jgi:2-hydroxychromene-2-carboxylate isomerase
MAKPDLHFYFDPVCRFAWMTSKWVRLVQAARDYEVEWRLISLRQINAHVDYDAHFPPEYEAYHDAGLRMLRVAAKARAELGSEAVDALQASIGAHVFDRPPWPSMQVRNRTVGSPEHVAAILAAAGLPEELVAALDDRSWDDEILAETTEARRLAGQDVGTPILHLEPPDGTAFFGPVLSRLPSPEQAVQLWDHVVGLARFAGFSELKRSLREQPQLQVFGLGAGDVGPVEDWHQGSTRQKEPGVSVAACEWVAPATSATNAAATV